MPLNTFSGYEGDGDIVQKNNEIIGNRHSCRGPQNSTKGLMETDKR